MISDKLIEHVKKYEGFKAKPYVDTVGKWTVGYGRNIEDNPLSVNEVVELFQHISWDSLRSAEVWAEDLMADDLANVQEELQRNLVFFNGLHDYEKLVLMDLGFNVGVPTLLKFKGMLHALDNDDSITASYELMNSRYAVQTKRRAAANARILANNDSNFNAAKEMLRERRPDIYLVLERWL